MPTRARLTVKLLAAAALAASTLASPAVAQPQQKFITVGTGGIVGVYYPLGGAICRFVNAGRKDHGLRCTVESTGGSVFNINAVMSGDMDIGFAQSDTQYYAMTGAAAFKDKPQPKLRALFSVYPELLTLVTRQDANIKTFADIKGKRINVGDPGSGTRVTTELVMKEMGIKLEELKFAGELKFVEMAPALCDNKIDAFTFVAGHPNAIFQEAATTCASSIASVTGPAVDKLVKDNPFYAKASVPGKLYKGTDNPQPTFGVMATVVASADLPEQTAYVITKAVFDNFDDFRKLHPAVANITKEQMLSGNTVPFHPGALKYFKEKGLVK
ncbi:MAG: TAXI family TRAP transporter solute-binding subunit [Ideonella sp.]|nr:TAXI family TRAP transporter solute-binding subunit [Ideonella sp.]